MGAAIAHELPAQPDHSCPTVNGTASIRCVRPHQIRDALSRIRAAEAGLFELAAGGTAVGTGLNGPPDFIREIAQLTSYPFVTAPNKFAAQGSLDAMVAAMTAVRGLAVALIKIANDMRWTVSGPSCGLGEFLLPENEPGSSIMPARSIRPSRRQWSWSTSR